MYSASRDKSWLPKIAPDSPWEVAAARALEPDNLSPPLSSCVTLDKSISLSFSFLISKMRAMIETTSMFLGIK